MSGWKSLLRADPIKWLLEEDNPSVRYYTLVDILDLPYSDESVVQAKTDIMRVGAVPRILSKQRDGGYWEEPGNFYIKTKYKGTVWTLLILAELGADGEDGRIQKTCNFIIEHSQERQSGGFAYLSDVSRGGDRNKILPCLTGNMVWSMLRFGYLNRPEVQQAIDWIVRYQRFDDAAETAPVGWPYDRYEKCWGKHTCHMGVVKALKALAEIPVVQRGDEVKNTIKKGAQYILEHHVHKQSHDLKRVANPEWLELGFPLMWQIDVLEILGVLTKLSYRDERMQEAVDLIVSKQNEQGRWTLEDTFNGRFQVSIERKNSPSKWITLNAVRVLKRFYS